MGKYLGPSCRKCRALGTKLFLKGAKCTSPKCAMEKNRFPPGQHGQTAKFRKDSDYKLHLKEKQRLKFAYGLMERQFRNYFDIAAKQKKAPTGDKLLELLERRLDNVVYRLGFQSSRKAARQIVSHGNIFVNRKRVSIPSYLVKTGDVVSLKEEKKSLDSVVESLESSPAIPSWLSLDKNKMEAKVLSLPSPEDIGFQVNTRLVIEFYSK